VFHAFGEPLGIDDYHPIAFTGSGTAVLVGGPGGPGVVAPDAVAIPTGQSVSVTNLPNMSPRAVYDVLDTYDPILLCIPSPGTGVVGRVKLAENVSPLPNDRVFLSYSHFQNVPLRPNGIDVDRYVAGFEKTTLDGMASAEFRFPFASTQSPDIVADGVTSNEELVFGNMSVIVKALLHAGDTTAVSAGLQVALPTADDITVSTPAGTQIAFIDNEAVHLMPYVGGLFTPNDTFFAQAFVQVDIDPNGNPVRIFGADAGRIHDTNFMYIDASVGQWLYRSRSRYDRLTGIAPMVEVHWNTSVQTGDAVQVGAVQVGNPAANVDIVNMVYGMVFEWNRSTTLTAAYAAPATDDEDFDGEFRLVFNTWYGPY
jgi:hypothetical protein